jgi:hypothetical protein
VKRMVLLATAATVYLLAAWMVAPGFYDGFTPPQPYNWVCPPPQAPPGNQAPGSGHLDIKVINGVSDANSVYTHDGTVQGPSTQVVIGFLPGAFDATGRTSISVDIKPVSPCPSPPGIHFATNTYQITASAPLVMAATLELVYSSVVPAPSDVYFATSTDGPWKSIGAAQQAQPFTIDTTTRQFGYFAAGYPSNATHPSSTTSQLLPIAVAILIVGVLIAGLPLAVLRRRRARGEEETDEEPDEEPEEEPDS